MVDCGLLKPQKLNFGYKGRTIVQATIAKEIKSIPFTRESPKCIKLSRINTMKNVPENIMREIK